MENNLKQKLIDIAKKEIEGNDPAHDFEHAKRVLHNVELISEKEGGDQDILVPAALFHDVVIYPKNHPKSDDAPKESADLTRKILEKEDEYPKEKIELVEHAIKECSFNKNEEPKDMETKILRDADRLEATGVVAIMRTFSSSGHMERPFYDLEDPFCENRKPNPRNFAVDLFYERLFVAKDRMYTDTAKNIAKERTKFLYTFIDELKRELDA